MLSNDFNTDSTDSDLNRAIPKSDAYIKRLEKANSLLQESRDKEENDIGAFARVLDVGTGVVSGVLKAAESVGQLGDDVGGAIARRIVNPLDAEARQESKEKVEKLQEENPTVLKKLSDAINPKTTPGKLVEPIAQFFGPFGAINKAAGGIKGVAGVPTIIKNIGTGAATDFVAFNGMEERLSNVIEKYPKLSNPITRFLKQDETDDWLQSRVKNVLEGSALSIGTEVSMAFVKVIRFIKEARQAKKSQASVKKTLDKEQIAIEKDSKTLNELQEEIRNIQAKVDPETEKIGEDLVKKIEDGTKLEGEVFSKGQTFLSAAREKMDDGDVSADYVIDNVIKPLVKNHLGGTRIASGAGKGLQIRSASDAVISMNKAEEAIELMAVGTTKQDFVRIVDDTLKKGKNNAKDLDKTFDGKKVIKRFSELSFMKKLHRLEMNAKDIYLNSLLASPETYFREAIASTYQFGYLPFERTVAAGIGSARLGLGKIGEKTASSLKLTDTEKYFSAWAKNTDRVRLKEGLIQWQSDMDMIRKGIVLVADGYKEQGFQGLKKSAKDISQKISDVGVNRYDQEFSNNQRPFSAESWGIEKESLGGRFFQYLSPLFYSRSVMVGIDNVKKAFLFNREKNALIYRQAMAEKEKGLLKTKADFNKRIEELNNDIPLDTAGKVAKKIYNRDQFVQANIQRQAKNYMQTESFTKPLQGSLQNIKKGVNSIPLSWTVMPFFSTPLQVLGRATDRVPLLSSLKKQWYSDMKRGGSARDTRLAQLALGTGAVAYGYNLYKEGRLTGGMMNLSPSERKIVRDKGILPIHVKLGDKFYNINSYDPIAFPFLVGAVLGEAHDFLDTEHRGELDQTRGDELSEFLYTSMFYMGNLMSSKTYFSSLGDVLKIVGETGFSGDSAKDVLTNIGSNFFVHGGLAFLSREILAPDDTFFEAHTMAEKIFNRYGFGDFPKRNFLGETVKREARLSGWFPLAYTQEKSTPLIDEVIRSNAALTKITNKIRGVELTPEQYDTLGEIMRAKVASGAGARNFLSNLISGSTYKDATDVNKKRILSIGMSKLKKQARMMLLEQDPELRERVEQKIIQDKTAPIFNPAFTRQAGDT